MVQCKHVTDFMSHSVTCQAHVIFIRIVAIRVVRVISLKRKNSAACAVICPPEHIVPIDARVQIKHRHSKNCIGVLELIRDQPIQNVDCVRLSIRACVVVTHLDLVRCEEV